MPRSIGKQRNQNLDGGSRVPGSSARTPTYRLRSGYYQAIVTLTDSATGKRRDYWLGEYGTRASRELYHRLIAAWEAADRRWPEFASVDVRGPHGGGHARAGSSGGSGGPVGNNAARGGVGQTAASLAADPEVAVAAVIKSYWAWARKYYRPDETGTLKVALRLLRGYYGTTPATSFGPTKLRLLREEMIRGSSVSDPPRMPWSRNYINSQVRRIQRMFKWAASHELIPASVHQALATVDPLKRGRSQARESEPVTPVPMELVEAAKQHVARPVAALIELQLLTGARGGELLKLRAIDIDTSDPGGIWVYQPREHKGSWRGRDRALYFGAQGAGSASRVHGGPAARRLPVQPGRRRGGSAGDSNRRPCDALELRQPDRHGPQSRETSEVRGPLHPCQLPPGHRAGLRPRLPAAGGP